jgi:uncharacterized protein YkwD
MKTCRRRSCAAVLAALLALNASAADCGLGDLQREVLRRVNEARGTGLRCGARSMAPAAPLAWDVSLYGAAASHSTDMARRNYFDHRSPEGRSVRQRASIHRYPWRNIGENIAGGDSTVAEVMQGWLASADHCVNIMDPGFSDVAVACAQQPATQWGTYWTMVLGRKR